MKCTNCGKSIKKSFNLCPSCGEEIVILKKERKFLNKKLIVAFCLLFVLLVISGYFLFFASSGVKKIRQSVVKVNVYDKEGEIIKTGSGFVVFDKNTLITNAHVITGGYKVDAITESNEKVFVDGAVYYSQDEDIAILKLNGQNSLKPLKTEKKYDVGQKVIAIGSPLGIKNSVSDGIISNVLEDGTIQHSAPISSGSSGGTLFNSKGRVIGMNTASYDAGQNLNLAISIKEIEEAYENAKNNKVKDIYKIQYIKYKDVKTVVLNNNPGKNIIDILKEKSGVDSFYCTEYKDSGVVDSYYMARIINEGYAENWIELYAHSDWNESDKYVESVIPQITIIKMNDLSDGVVQDIIYLLEQESQSAYEQLMEDPYDRVVQVSGGVVDWTEGYEKVHRYSTEYLEAIKNPTINIHGQYVYMIVCSDRKITKEIVKEIHNLP